MQALEEIAFRPGEDSAELDSIVAAFQLWDRIGLDALPAVQALGSTDVQAQDRAEWMLVQAGPNVLADVRKALRSENSDLRNRAIRILAWQGDTDSLETLRDMRKTDSTDAPLIDWAIAKIQSLHPVL
jgi:glycerophosphoryl diester phosphodiesterase